MQAADQIYSNSPRRGGQIRLGYVRLLDAAPIIIAEAYGLFEDVDLNVKLFKEPGWASVRDKLAFGELHVSQALGPMPLAMQLGMNVVQTDVIAGMILNCNGNAITLSNTLKDEGVNDGGSFRRYIRNGFRARKPVIGVVSQTSSHNFTLCRWLEEHSITPHDDVIITVLPPEQMVRNLAADNLDGFCVGEPWNTLAILENVGWCAATSNQVAAGYPEKVLATTERFYTYRKDEYVKMISALIEACRICDDLGERSRVVSVLSDGKYLDCSEDILQKSLSGELLKSGSKSVSAEFIRFHGSEVNRPSEKWSKALYQDLLRYTPTKPKEELSDKDLFSIFRDSIYDQAPQHVVS